MAYLEDHGVFVLLLNGEIAENVKHRRSQPAIDRYGPVSLFAISRQSPEGIFM